MRPSGVGSGAGSVGQTLITALDEAAGSSNDVHEASVGLEAS
jgi:hypothetical protein